MVSGTGLSGRRGKVARATVAWISACATEIFSCGALTPTRRLRTVGCDAVPADTTLRPNRPDVLDETFDGEAVLVNLRLGRYYALDAAASEVWAAICDGLTVGALAAAVGAPRGLDAAAALAWVAPLLRRFAEEELVTVAGGPLPAGEPAPGAPPAPELQAFTDMEDLLLLDPIHDVDLDGSGWPQAPRSATG